MAAVNFPDPTQQNPDTGATYGEAWYNAENGVTYQYSNGVWAAISVPSSSLDDRYVRVIGDNMTGDLTLGAAGDPKITLDPNGAANFAARIYPQSASLNFKQGYTGQVLGVYEGLDSDTAAKIQLNNDGSASFAGRVTASDFKGGDLTTEIIAGQFYSNSSNSTLPTLYSRNADVNGLVFTGVGSATTTSTIAANGAASFSGKITTASTEDSDPDNTVVTKDYLDGSGGTGTLGYWDRTGTTLSPVNDGDDVEVDGNFILTTDANTVDAGTNTYIWGLGGGDSNGHHLELSKKTKAGAESRILRVDRSSGDLNVDNNVLIGGTLPSAPNISLGANGAARFFSSVAVGDSHPVGILSAKVATNGVLHVRDMGDVGIGDGVALDVLDDSGSTVQNLAIRGKEIQLYTATPNIEVARIDDSGNLLIGGTLPSAPNISLNADGSAGFAGRILVGADTTKERVTITDNGQIQSIWAGNTVGINKYIGGASYFISGEKLDDPGTLRFAIKNDGSGTFAGDIGIGGTLPSAPNISLNASGRGTFGDGVRIDANGIISYDGNTRPTFYVGEDGEIRVGDSVLAAGGRHFRIQPDGTTTIGDDAVTSAGTNISLNADGSANFAGKVKAQSFDLESLPLLPTTP